MSVTVAPGVALVDTLREYDDEGVGVEEPPPPTVVIDAAIVPVLFGLVELEMVKTPFEAVCIFVTDTETDGEEDSLLEEDELTVIEFTGDTETLFTSESVPTAPAAVCEPLNDTELLDVREFVWLTDTDPDVDIVVLELTVTLAVKAELRELNPAVDDKRLVGLFAILAEEVKLALAVAAVV